LTKKKLLIITFSLVAVAAAIIVSTSVLAGKSSEQLSILSIDEGNVLVMKAGTNNWIEAQIGMSLEEDDIIAVGNDSLAVITFFDGTTIELAASTNIEIKDLEPANAESIKTISIKQEIGRTVSRVKKLVDTGARYQIETPSGTAVVRGTTMVIDVDPEGISKVFNEEGSVFVTAQGEEIQLPEGMQSIILPDQPPSVPYHPGGEGAGSIRITRNRIAKEGTTITYVYEVTNVGDTQQSNVIISDDEVHDTTYISGDINNNNMLDPGETWIFTGTQSTQ
jgi:hypothetical protein